MQFPFSRRKIAPLATILMAIMLTSCVSEGGYYEVDTGYRDYRRDEGRVYRPPRDYRRDRWDPPRRDYGRTPPPSIYDDRGYRERDRDTRYSDRRDQRPPYPPPYEPPRRSGGNVSIYQYSGG
jgi:hypothetical protein